jgi:hypothetical protein
MEILLEARRAAGIEREHEERDKTLHRVPSLEPRGRRER